MQTLTDEHMLIARHLMRWLSICRESGYIDREYGGDVPRCFNSANVRHSALLRRLMQGKEPLALPPPRSFSYPWYDLVDTGQGDAGNISIYDEGDELFAGKVFINQCADWTIIEKRSDTEYVVQSDSDGLRYLLFYPHHRVITHYDAASKTVMHPTIPVWGLERLRAEDDGNPIPSSHVREVA